MSETTDTQYYTPPEVLREMCEQLQRELAAAKQIMGELCESCGWAMRLPDQPCRCELERELAEALYHRAQVDVLTAERDTLAEALRELLRTGDNGYGTPTDKAWEMAEAAIAAVKGGRDE
jgi:hypothetical protein